MLQRMTLRLLKIITPINRIEPRVEKVLCPVAIPHDNTRRYQPLFILRDDKVDAVAFEVSERLDYAVRGDDGLVGEHDVLEARGLQHVRLQV